MSQQARRSGARHDVMRELNRSLVLDLIKQHSPISRASLAEVSALAKPTVSAIVEELVEQGKVREVGVGNTTREGGRPPVLLEFDARSQCLVGVHVGVNTTTVVLADALGREFGRRQMPTRTEPAGRTIKRIAAAVQSVAEEAHIPGGSLAIGVCLPGMTDPSTGVCRLAPALGWVDVPVRSLLQEALHVPVFVHNTAQAAAVAESLEGAAAGYADVALIYLGSGIGSGVLIGGRLLSGATGQAGELGHCPVEGGTQQCPCGRMGCLETEASGLALLRSARQAASNGTSQGLAARGAELSVPDIAAAAAGGDAVAADLIAETGRRLGVAAAWLVNLTNPEVLVLSGGLVEIGGLLLDPLRAALERHALPQVNERLHVRQSRLGSDAEVRGAVLLAMQYTETYYRVVFQGR